MGSTAAVRRGKSISAITLSGVEEYEYWSKSEVEIKISPSNPDIMTVEVYEGEIEKNIEVTLERPEEPKKRNKGGQPSVLVKPPVSPRLLVKYETRMVEKGHLEILHADDSLMLDGLDKT
ncbi:hypothetical protein Scep_025890 [Stephania cephalantha]|uniref:Uncharacterized protein n=1 Tax=Stephania cephalantha TaxID=152367 RepID=A0AAP0EJ39_9MAGN